MDLTTISLALLKKEISSSCTPARRKRLYGALELIERGAISLKCRVAASGEDLYGVKSRSGSSCYEVIPDECTCADHQYRSCEGIVCAHREALRVYLIAQAVLKPINECQRLGLQLRL